MSILESQSKKMVADIGWLTIPPRLNHWLRNSRPGYYIPFHEVFKDELPEYEDRASVLGFLAWSPEALQGGLVDVDSGLIYRYSRNARDRLLSFLILIVAFFAAAGIIVGAAYLPLETWPLDPTVLPTLLIGWAALLAGLVVHVGIGIAKRVQAQRGRPPIIAVGDLPLLVNAKVGHILLKILLTLVGLFGLLFSLGVESTTPVNAFLVGYTLDSVFELFGAGIEQRAGAQMTALRKQVDIANR
ncbi:MAG TPA: hypothetical protein VFR55_08925 [Dehalococcoidia bacterium]|nr:hypothetical protein [Dehalococcoidia bacterium]